MRDEQTDEWSSFSNELFILFIWQISRFAPNFTTKSLENKAECLCLAGVRGLLLFVSVFGCVYCRLLVLCWMNNIFFACTFSFCCWYCGCCCCCCLPCCMGSYAHFCICYTHKHKQKHFTPCVDVFRVFFICHCINIIFSSHHIVSTLLFFAFGCVLHFINATLFIFFLFILV